MNDVTLRAATGALLAALAILATVLGGYVFAILAAAAATAVFYEWTRLARGWGLGWQVSGFFYALAAALALLWIRDRADEGLYLVMWVFVIVWATDIGAYFTGRAFGARKLAPAISPGKTWAGFYGGLAAATLLGGAWAILTDLPLGLILLAPFLSVVAQCGDLFESWMKRRAGVKDSGHWLPGHGGVFDRLDGLLPAAILTALAVIAGIA